MKIKITDKGVFFSSVFALAVFVGVVVSIHVLAYDSLMIFVDLGAFKKFLVACVIVLTWELDKIIYQAAKEILK